MNASSDNTLSALLTRHDEEKFRFDLLTEPEKQRYQIKMRSVYANDPWKFLCDAVMTLDQVDSKCPIKPFPSYLEYLQFICALWQKKKLIAVPKSRRMTASWGFISLFTHDTIFHSGRFNGFVSKKEDDAAELVARAEFIYNNIPEWRIPRALLPRLKNGKMSKQPPIMEFEDINSKIQGFPMGADQLRQFTLSGIFGDEVAFWPEAQQFYSASKPTIDGGGRMSLVSSRSPGFFKKIVFDRLDEPDLTFREVAPVATKNPMEGVEVWENPNNRFVVVDLHYTANPAKRGDAWREAIRRSMPARDFAMEYEKSWQTYEGRAVYEDYRKDIHVLRGTIEPEPGLPLLLGWDFGLTPACVLTQLVGNQLRVLKEFIELDGSILKLAPEVWKHLSVNYLPWTHSEKMLISFVDPAGFQRAQTDARTCAGILRQEGFTDVLPGPVNWEPRRQAVEKFLIRIDKKGAGLQMSEEGCPILIEGFGGGYAYPKSVIDIQGDNMRPVKNKFSHPHDALQYVCAGASAKLKQYDMTPQQAPSYGFQQNNRSNSR